MHVDFFRDTIQYGRQAAILLRFVQVRSHNSDMSQPISFKVGTRTLTCALHMHVNLFCDMILFGCVRGIFVSFSKGVTVAVKVRNCKKIAGFFQSLYKDIDLFHTLIFFVTQSNMAARGPFCYRFFMSGAIT